MILTSRHLIKLQLIRIPKQSSSCPNLRRNSGPPRPSLISPGKQEPPGVQIAAPWAPQVSQDLTTFQPCSSGHSTNNTQEPPCTLEGVQEHPWPPPTGHQQHPAPPPAEAIQHVSRCCQKSPRRQTCPGWAALCQPNPTALTIHTRALSASILHPMPGTPPPRPPSGFRVLTKQPDWLLTCCHQPLGPAPHHSGQPLPHQCPLLPSKPGQPPNPSPLHSSSSASPIFFFFLLFHHLMYWALQSACQKASGHTEDSHCMMI